MDALFQEQRKEWKAEMRPLVISTFLTTYPELAKSFLEFEKNPSKVWPLCMNLSKFVSGFGQRLSPVIEHEYEAFFRFLYYKGYVGVLCNASFVEGAYNDSFVQGTYIYHWFTTNEYTCLNVNMDPTIRIWPLDTPKETWMKEALETEAKWKQKEAIRLETSIEVNRDSFQARYPELCTQFHTLRAQALEAKEIMFTMDTSMIEGEHLDLFRCFLYLQDCRYVTYPIEKIPVFHTLSRDWMSEIGFSEIDYDSDSEVESVEIWPYHTPHLMIHSKHVGIQHALPLPPKTKEKAVVQQKEIAPPPPTTPPTTNHCIFQ